MKRSTLVYLLVGLLLAAAASETLADTVYLGETATGRMAGPGSTHELSVDLVAGDAVRLKVKAKGAGDQAPAVTVTDPAGTVVANASGRRSLNLRIAAAMTGTYRVRLAAVAGGSDAFLLALDGPRSRKVEGSAGQAAVDAVEGSVLEIQVRSARGASADVEARDARGAPIPLRRKQNGRKLTAKSEAVAATGTCRIVYAPAEQAATVKVQSPKPRGRINLGTAAAPADPATSAPAPADSGDATTAPPPPAPALPTPPAPPKDDEGRDGNRADHDYLSAVLLEGPVDEKLTAAVTRVADEDPRLVDELLRRLAEEYPHAVLDRIAERLDESGLAGREAREGTLERMAALVDANDRLGRAAARREALSRAVAGTALAADVDYERAANDAAADLDDRQAALDRAMSTGLRAYLQAGDREIAAALSAPAANHDAAALAGMAALERQVIDGAVRDAALAGDAEALDLAAAVYRTHRAMLAANGDEDPRLDEILRELEERAAHDESEESADAADRLTLRVGNADAEEVALEPGREVAIHWEGGSVRITADPAENGVHLSVRLEIEGEAVEITGIDAGDMEMEPSPNGVALNGSAAYGEDISIRFLQDGRDEGLSLQVRSGR